MPISAPQVYVRELERLKFGRPVYNPEHPINIGDVGFFDKQTGDFCALFNVFVDAAEQVNAKLGTPNGFEPLSRTSLYISAVKDYFPAQPIQSSSVESKTFEVEASADALIATAGVGITFSCSKKLGATLVLRATSTRVDIRDNDHVDRYISKHIDSWYEYASRLGYRKRQAPEGSLVLIKGCNKTSSWAHATFSECRKEGTVSFAGGYVNTGGAVHLKGSWTSAVSAIHREAPLGEQPTRSDVLLVNELATASRPTTLMVPDDVPVTEIFPSECVYTIFVRVYRIRRRSVLGMLKVLTVEVDGQASRMLQHQPEKLTLGSVRTAAVESSPAGWKELDDDLQLGGHLLDKALDYILEKAPEATVAIASDDDIFALCPDYILPSDIDAMLDDLQPVCTSPADGVSTLRLHDIMSYSEDVTSTSEVEPFTSAGTMGEFPCPHCSHIFIQRLNLEKHVKSHGLALGRNGVRRNEVRSEAFTCSKPGCGATFMRSHNLKNHESSHDDQNDYVCPVCSRAFTRLWDLKRHVASKHPEHHETRPQDCQRHMMTKHPELME